LILRRNRFSNFIHPIHSNFQHCKKIALFKRWIVSHAFSLCEVLYLFWVIPTQNWRDYSKLLSNFRLHILIFIYSLLWRKSKIHPRNIYRSLFCRRRTLPAHFKSLSRIDKHSLFLSDFSSPRKLHILFEFFLKAKIPFFIHQTLVFSLSSFFGSCDIFNLNLTLSSVQVLLLSWVWRGAFALLLSGDCRGFCCLCCLFLLVQLLDCLDLFLEFHPPVLKPNFDLSLCEA